jgi:glycosyltransferase involved in cell wall biosynthesis
VAVIADPGSLIANRAHLYGVPLISARLRKKRLRDLLSLSRSLREFRPDIVACHSSTDHWLVALTRLLFRVRFAIVRFRHISTLVKQTRVNRWLYQKGAEAVITTSQVISKQLVTDRIVPIDQVFSIPTGVDPSTFPVKDTSKGKQSLGIIGHEFVISIVATLRSWKGHADLLAAISRLADRQIRLIIVGDGPQRLALLELVDELALVSKVTFTGHQMDVTPYLQASDLFVLPSYANEGVPQAILQAMAMGLPIISCATGGIPEAVQSYSGARIIEPRNIEKLTQEIKYVIDQWNSNAIYLYPPAFPFTETSMLEKSIKIHYAAQKKFQLYERRSRLKHTAR